MRGFTNSEFVPCDARFFQDTKIPSIFGLMGSALFSVISYPDSILAPKNSVCPKKLTSMHTVIPGFSSSRLRPERREIPLVKPDVWQKDTRD